MDKNPLKTNENLSPLFQTQAAGAPQPSALAKSVTIGHVFTPEGRGTPFEVILADYQAVACMTRMKWQKDATARTYRPDQDYTDTIHGATVLEPPEDVSDLPDAMPATLIVLNDGTSLLTWLDEDDLNDRFAKAEKDALRTLERMSAASSENAIAAIARQTISEPLQFRAANPGRLQGITEMTLRNARDVRFITKLEWSKGDNGKYHPACHYGDDLHSGISFDPAFMPNDETAYLPSGLITLQDGRTFLSWDDADEIATRLDRAQKEVTGKLAAFMRNFSEAPQPLPKAQPQTKSATKSLTLED